MGILSKVVSYGWRAIKAAPKLIFGTNSDAVGKAMKTAYKGTTTGSVFTKAKAAAKAGAKVLESGATGKAFLKQIGKDIVTLPKSLARGAKAGYLKAIHAGKSGILGGVKGFFGKVGKKMPLIGTLLMIGCELPNIFKAGSDRGVGEAAKETGKAAARLAGGALGAAIGSAICPGLGSLVGWIAGEWLTSKVVGKTYTEKKDEATDKLRELGLSDEEIDAAEKQGQDIIELADLAEKQLAEQGETEAQGLKKEAPTPTTTTAATTAATTTTTAQTKTTQTDPYRFYEVLNILNSEGLYGLPITGSMNPYTLGLFSQKQYPQGFNYSA